MEKRVVLFIVICLGIIIGWDFLIKKYAPAPIRDQTILEESARSNDASPDTAESESSSPAESVTAGSEKVEAAPSAGSDGAAAADSSGRDTPPEQLVTIDTPLYRAQLSNRGAEIVSWKLNNYLTRTDDPEPIELVYAEGQFAGPLAVHVDDETQMSRLRDAVYDVEHDATVLNDRQPVARVTFTYRDAEGAWWLKKALTFHHDSYVVDVDVTSEGLSDELDVLVGTNFGIVEWEQGFIGSLGPAWMIGDEIEKTVPDVQEGSDPGEKPRIERSGEIRWAGLQDKYFIGVIMPESAERVFAVEELEHVVTAGVRFQAAGDDHAHSFKLYAGPKQFDRLKAFQVGLEDTIDFGWFIFDSWTIVKAVAKPLFSVLRFFYDYTHNYGLAIILVTVCIKLLFVPLQYKSYKSMQGMQKIQPKVLELQNKYKDDREKLNKELMKLYRDHKVNPVGGCLPMFLQMPAFISLFNILYMTVDLRQAPFMLWVTDLSVPDPFYVLPVLMGASMVLQQKIMPTTMDPAQAKMMLILPVFLTFLFLTFPAGLVLYWLTNNVLTITQQFVTDRFIFKKTGGESTQAVSKADGGGAGKDSAKQEVSSAPVTQEPSKPTEKRSDSPKPKSKRKNRK